MSDYGYKAIMRSVDCGVSRAVAFHHQYLFTRDQAAEEATKHMTSQTCIRCNKNHQSSDFCMVELEIH